MLGLLQDILCVLQSAANGVLWALMTALNGVLFAVGAWLQGVTDLLPDMPANPDALDVTVLQYVNWLFPVGGLVSLFAGFLALWAAWLLIRIPLRWAKVV